MGKGQKKEIKTAAILVRVSPELRDALFEICEREGRQMSKVIRNLVAEYVEKHRPRKGG